MSYETSKCYSRRFAQGHLQKLRGKGLDIGGGDDCLKLPWSEIRLWDKKNEDGDAAELKGIEQGSLDFVYSSHTLEHIKDPKKVLTKWISVVKSGGYIYIAVPDFDLYEGGLQIRNNFHKCGFSMNRENLDIPLYNVFNLVRSIYGVYIEYVGLCDDNYDYSLPKTVDQTKKQATCQIEMMLRKL